MNKVGDIPEDLRERPQWVLHRDKVPLQPDGSYADSTDLATWNAFEAGYARRAYNGPDTEAYRTGCKARPGPCTSEGDCVSCKYLNSKSGPRPVTAACPFYTPGLPFGRTCPDCASTGSAAFGAQIQVRPFFRVSPLSKSERQ
jgi:hypothetical protein